MLAFPDPPEAHVWLKIGHVLGTPVVTSTGWSDSEELAAQKALLDVLWNVTLEELLTDTEPPAGERSEDETWAARLTDESAVHQDEMRSFEAVYEAELAGFWDANEDAVADGVDAMFRSAGIDFPESGPEKDEQTRLYKNVLRNIIKLDRAQGALPTAQVVAGLYAVVRWNRRRFRATDDFDFHHAAAALPYCDVFLTEKFLSTVLRRPPLSFDERFDTVVEHEEQAALDLLERLARDAR